MNYNSCQWTELYDFNTWLIKKQSCTKETFVDGRASEESAYESQVTGEQRIVNLTEISRLRRHKVAEPRNLIIKHWTNIQLQVLHLASWNMPQQLYTRVMHLTQHIQHSTNDDPLLDP